MVKKADKGNTLEIEDVRVNYDYKNDSIRVTSGDSVLKNFLVHIKKGTPTDVELRSIFRAEGIIRDEIESAESYSDVIRDVVDGFGGAYAVMGEKKGGKTTLLNAIEKAAGIRGIEVIRHEYVDFSIREVEDEARRDAEREGRTFAVSVDNRRAVWCDYMVSHERANREETLPKIKEVMETPGRRAIVLVDNPPMGEATSPLDKFAQRAYMERVEFLNQLRTNFIKERLGSGVTFVVVSPEHLSLYDAIIGFPTKGGLYGYADDYAKFFERSVDEVNTALSTLRKYEYLVGNADGFTKGRSNLTGLIKV